MATSTSPTEKISAVMSTACARRLLLRDQLVRYFLRHDLEGQLVYGLAITMHDQDNPGVVQEYNDLLNMLHKTVGCSEHCHHKEP